MNAQIRRTKRTSTQTLSFPKMPMGCTPRHTAAPASARLRAVRTRCNTFQHLCTCAPHRVTSSGFTHHTRAAAAYILCFCAHKRAPPCRAHPLQQVSTSLHVCAALMASSGLTHHMRRRAHILPPHKRATSAAHAAHPHQARTGRCHNVAHTSRSCPFPPVP